MAGRTGALRVLGIAPASVGLRGGLTAALIETDGAVLTSFGTVHHRRWRPRAWRRLRRGGACAAEAVLAEAAADLVARFGPGGAGAIGLGGQGDAAVLAEHTGLPVVSDFAATDLRLGGAGGPLGAVFHHALVRHLGAEAPVAVVDLAAVTSLTWVDPRRADPLDQQACLAFETGPGLALLSERLNRRGVAAGCAAPGRADAAVMARVAADPYACRLPPKRLRPGDFRDLVEMTRGCPDADAAATLLACIATGIVQGVDLCPAPPAAVLACGPGCGSPALMQMLQSGLDCPVQSVAVFGLDPAASEAQAFAFLAARVLRGLPTTGPTITGVSAVVGGGTVTRPSCAAAPGHIDQL